MVQSALLPLAGKGPTKTAAGRTSALSIVDQYLAVQQSLSAVETFSRWQTSQPLQARYYQSLLPATLPAPGQQYAFEVNLDRCSGCKACVTACHALNGLDETESFRDVGLLIGGQTENPVIQHVTTACHHCLEPACAIACPVDAYTKDPVTGIVKHLDDQCFGCQYCTLACPYDVPKYHDAKGIVRKCDMCQDRLAVGEAPACVQACPHEAIRISLVSTEESRQAASSDDFLAGTPNPEMTLPTTIYRGDRSKLAGAVSADRNVTRHEHAHWTLIILLVLTQLAVGAFCFDVALLAATSVMRNVPTFLPLPMTMPMRLAVLVVGVVGIAAGTFHLGRPWLAYRALIGLRHSWLSREILAFGVFIKSAAVYTFLSCWAGELKLSPVWLCLSSLIVVAGGLAGVWCSARIYIFTKRPFWNHLDTYRKFLGTTVIGGLTCLTINQISSPTGAEVSALWSAGATVGLLTVVITLKYLAELRLYPGHSIEDTRLQQQSKRLLKSDLKTVSLTRLALAITGSALLFVSLACMSQSPGLALSVACTGGLLVLCGEVSERYCFFAGVVAHKMPGGITT